MNSILLNVFTGAIARRSDLPITKATPDVWPKQEMSEINGFQAEGLLFRAADEYEEIQPRGPSSSRNSPGDQFFDSMSRQSTPPTRIEETSMPSYLLFNTGTSITTELGDSDWRYYDPPRELIDCQTNSSREIKDILKSSIDRIKTRHDEEADRLLREMATEELSRAPNPEGSRLEVRHSP